MSYVIGVTSVIELKINKFFKFDLYIAHQVPQLHNGLKTDSIIIVPHGIAECGQSSASMNMTIHADSTV